MPYPSYLVYNSKIFEIQKYGEHISHTSEFRQHFFLSDEEDTLSSHSSENRICNVVQG
jgi:hypothetical protein